MQTQLHHNSTRAVDAWMELHGTIFTEANLVDDSLTKHCFSLDRSFFSAYWLLFFFLFFVLLMAVMLESVFPWGF